MDPDNPDIVALMPASMTGGQKSPQRQSAGSAGAWTAAAAAGAKAAGKVLSAAPQPLNNPALEGKGFSRWQLMLEVRPENGSPTYQAELVISLTSPEKAPRIAHAGADATIRQTRKRWRSTSSPWAMAIPTRPCGKRWKAGETWA